MKTNNDFGGIISNKYAQLCLSIWCPREIFSRVALIGFIFDVHIYELLFRGMLTLVGMFFSALVCDSEFLQ